MTVRLIDHLCPRHATKGALHRWPIAGDFSDLLTHCLSCNLAARRLQPNDTYSIRCLPDLDHCTYEHSDAIHEAAHAVLGMHAGMPLVYATVVPRTDEIQAGPHSHVKWGPYEQVQLDLWAATVWAGQRAQVRWFTARGLDTAANLVDLASQGCHDTKQVLDAAAEYRVAEDIGWDRCAELLDEHWTAVERVADMLLAHGRLTGDEIADLTAILVRIADDHHAECVRSECRTCDNVREALTVRLADITTDPGKRRSRLVRWPG